ncbi:hypothetical protein CG51_17590 [Haematobacter missouriensis]|nr:hypothetical protein CG51_17590 [Haematobacter missouriensis]
MQEFLYVFRETHTIIELGGIAGFDLIQIEHQREGKVLGFGTLRFGKPLKRALELVADIIAMHRLVAYDKADKVGSVGQLCPGRPPHRQVETRIEQEAFKKHAGDLAA